MKLCPASRRKQQENTFLMKHISETNERQFHCIKSCFQGKLNRIYPFYKAVTIQSNAFHLTCKDTGYQHPFYLQCNEVHSLVEHNRLMDGSAEILSQEYTITQPHCMKPALPNQWPHNKTYVFSSF